MKDSLAKWICGPTGSRICARAQRRSAIEQRRDRFPGGPLVGEAVGLLRHAEAVARLERDAERLSGQRVSRLAAVGVDVDAGEALAQEVVGDDLARRIERGPHLVDRGRAPWDPSRCPDRACIAAAPAGRRPWRARPRPWRNRRHRCGHRSRDRSSRSRARCPAACRGWRRRPSCTKCAFCVPLQQVAWPSLISTSAQAGPMQACDWNGHSYSASITRAGDLERRRRRCRLACLPPRVCAPAPGGCDRTAPPDRGTAAPRSTIRP